MVLYGVIQRQNLYYVSTSSAPVYGTSGGGGNHFEKVVMMSLLIP